MKGRENNLEGLMANDLAFIQAGKGKNLPSINLCLHWFLYRQAPIY